ncbi:MAG: ABC-2 family transporter protein [bacterium]|nr:ABC-2 family transporter protein [bacterium]
MKQYWNVYKMLCKLNFSKLLAYRGNFINSLISSTGYGLLSFLVIVILTSQTPMVFGWKREELILLMGVYNMLVGGVYSIFIVRNFDRFVENVDMGRLDSYLMKPIDSQFLLSVSTISYVQVIRFIMGFLITVYMMSLLHIKITMFQLLLFIFLSFFSIVLLYSLWYLIITMTIWNTKLSNLVDLMYRFNDLARFPPKMFDAVKNYFIFIIPYLFIIVTPVKVLLNKATMSDVVGLVFFSLLLFYISRKFWKYALKSYTSASS